MNRRCLTKCSEVPMLSNGKQCMTTKSVPSKSWELGKFSTYHLAPSQYLIHWSSKRNLDQMEMFILIKFELLLVDTSKCMELTIMRCSPQQPKCHRFVWSWQTVPYKTGKCIR